MTVTGSATINWPGSGSPTVATTGSGNNGSVTVNQAAPLSGLGTIFTNSPNTGNQATTGNVQGNLSLTSQPATDPYQGISPPVTNLGSIPNGAASWDGYPVWNTSTYSGPGIYTKELKVQSATQFASGVYIFLAGIKTSGLGGITIAPFSATQPGGVLFYVYAGEINFSGSSNVTLTPLPGPPYTVSPPAPTLVLWDAASSNVVSLVGNGSTTEIDGTVYAPDATVSTSGNGAVNATSIVAGGLACNGGGSSGQINVG
jgi:hypothetical protein